MTDKDNDRGPNSSQKRLRRIETRLTNFGRWMGVDLTKPPAPNAPDQPVFIDGGAVYATPRTSFGELMLAVMRYQEWHAHDREVPIVVGGRTVGTIDPIALRMEE